MEFDPTCYQEGTYTTRYFVHRGTFQPTSKKRYCMLWDVAILREDSSHGVVAPRPVTGRQQKLSTVKICRPLSMTEIVEIVLNTTNRRYSCDA